MEVGKEKKRVVIRVEPWDLFVFIKCAYFQFPESKKKKGNGIYPHRPGERKHGKVNRLKS